VEQAIAAYTQLCSVEISEVTPTECVIELRPAPLDASGEDRLVHEFLNYLLDLCVESHIAVG
jgi:hypothetical protein